MECSSGCGRPLSDPLMKCRHCKRSYHCECLNINVQQYQALTKDQLACWQCPSCCNVSRRHKTNNENTPVRNSVIPPDETSISSKLAEKHATYSEFDHRNFTQDLQGMLYTWRQEIDSSLHRMTSEITNALSDLKLEVQTLRTEYTNLKNGLATVTNDVIDLKSSAQFQGQQLVDLEQKVHDLEKFKANSIGSGHLVSSLEHKIDYLEQQARQCNIEICNVPEKRNENLLSILEAIASVIKYPISNKEIISIHRVPHANQQSNRQPKNIIVKLSTKILRDNILSGFRKARCVSSEQIGIQGQSQYIYMNEHLTLKHKQLFRECREEAKKHKYKYIWIRNATILVRENDTSPSFAVRSTSDFAKFKSRDSKMET